ncbi:ImmA/IrrE family metallo-endopeptidase [Streptomyces verrucosisporus]|uniref:ImmA/IrrE family metallo-endopeptidase n=1 Tax=Streptomyces verrucosisporus TaxID=1695161 RepID=UPI0019D0B880|nr:ImmA/IrrE family metallo-endopeptidase [Streptomyces verrucosisporus]MBN3931108.1 ImmA/IrrE family metallo-endopeptidase [Streptomyces verrucosisporus]
MAASPLRLPGRRRARFREMQRDCERRLAEIGVVPGHDGTAGAAGSSGTEGITDVCEQVGRRRGRAIRLVPMELEEPLLHGLWIALPDTDVIVYRANTSRPHQEHIIAHELSHIICEHDFGALPGPAVPAHLFPEADPDLVRRSLKRSAYDDRAEQEAEMMASLLLAHARRKAAPGPEDADALPPEDATVMARVESVVGRG